MAVVVHVSDFNLGLCLNVTTGNGQRRTQKSQRFTVSGQPGSVI